MLFRQPQTGGLFLLPLSLNSSPLHLSAYSDGNVILRLIGGQTAVGMELPAGEDQRDQVDEGSDPAVGGRLQEKRLAGDSGRSAPETHLEESLVRSRKELFRVAVMRLHSEVLDQGHAVDVEEDSHQGLEGAGGQ